MNAHKVHTDSAEKIKQGILGLPRIDNKLQATASNYYTVNTSLQPELNTTQPYSHLWTMGVY